MTLPSTRRSISTGTIARILDDPELVRAIPTLPPQSFSALVRRIGIEDAGELVALASVEQLVAAFDEDLFSNVRPGEREMFDPDKFAIWLEVLLEASDEVAARRVAELSEDFVARALGSLVLVLDEDSLRQSMDDGGADARRVDKELESALTEELDGYVLVARRSEGWDAALALILALDRDHRPLLERVLDRIAATTSELTEDLHELSNVLSAGASLEEDVEAEREERRAREGFVEPRAAKAFLTLAREPWSNKARTERDPLTRAYFRDLEPRRPAVGRSPSRSLRARSSEVTPSAEETSAALSGVSKEQKLLSEATPSAEKTSAALSGVSRGRREEEPGEALGIVLGMRRLALEAPELFTSRAEELAYLTNVLVAAGTKSNQERYLPAEAAEAILLTVTLGAELWARSLRDERGRPADHSRATPEELLEVLLKTPIDLLFRRASSALDRDGPGVLRTRGELETFLSKGRSLPRKTRRRPRDP